MLSEEEVEQAVSDAKRVGVAGIVSCSTSFLSNEKNILLSQRFPEIKAALGLYPLDALELTETEINKAFDYFKSNAKKAIAIGEVGLDYKYCKNKEEQEKQLGTFARFIELSKEISKPLIVHSRFAQKQVLELLIEHNAEKVLLHSFVDSPKLMKQAAEKGFFVSAGLALLDNAEMQKNIASFPLENLLFETDSPIKFRGKSAAPARVTLIAQKVSAIKELSLPKIEAVQEKNFLRLFGML